MSNIRSYTFPPNENGKDFVVGDIHGCYYELLQKLGEVEFNHITDRLFAVGDLIDRGSHSEECLRLVNESWFFSVIGNHEEMMRAAYRHPDRYEMWRAHKLWLSNGGQWVDGYSNGQIEGLLDIIDTLPVFLNINHKSGNKVGICHAQPPTEDWDDIAYGLNDTEITRAMWGRTIINTKPIGYKCNNIDLTVHGHTPREKITKVGNSIFIDLGVYKGGEVGIINLDEYFEEVE